MQAVFCQLLFSDFKILPEELNAAHKIFLHKASTTVVTRRLIYTRSINNVANTFCKPIILNSVVLNNLSIVTD